MAFSITSDAALSAASGAFFTSSTALSTASVAFSAASDAALSATSGAFLTSSVALSTASTLSVSCAGYSEAFRAAL